MTQQEYVASVTEQKVADLIAAYAKIPADKRDWSPGGNARTALDLYVECVIMNSYTVSMLQTHKWNDDNQSYEADKVAVAALPVEEQTARLTTGIQTVAAIIRTVPDEALPVVIAMPWGNSTLSEVAEYSYWNMSYHEGQINYIASILGVLE